MKTPEQIAKIHAELATISGELKAFVEQCEGAGVMNHDEAIRYALLQMVAELRVEMREVKAKAEEAHRKLFPPSDGGPW